MNFKAFFAILICKLVRFGCRLFKRGGTALPGKLALKLCPNILSVVSKGVKVIAVTGTNGKTTSSRMIEQAFADSDKSYLANRSGANLSSGIATEFISSCTLFGRCLKEYAIIECDEAAARTVFLQLKPQIIVVTNLFRDQLDRFGEVSNTQEKIREGIENAPDAILCLNADCSLCSSLAEGLPNKTVFFGINKGVLKSAEKPELSDASHCLHCKTEYEYDYVTYAHLGGFRCPSCGYRRHEPEYAVTALTNEQLNGSGIRLSIRGEEHEAFVKLPAVYNINNAIGAIAAIVEAGLDTQAALSAVASFKRGFGRMEDFKLGGGIKMILTKNPAGCDRVIEFLMDIKKSFTLVVCLNDKVADGTDISWIWDAHFEKLAEHQDRINKIYVCGDRARDMALRLKYAGIDAGKTMLEPDYDRLVQTIEGLDCQTVIMPTYTAMLELREKLIKRCGGDKFWA